MHRQTSRSRKSTAPMCMVIVRLISISRHGGNWKMRLLSFFALSICFVVTGRVLRIHMFLPSREMLKDVMSHMDDMVQISPAAKAGIMSTIIGPKPSVSR